MPAYGTEGRFRPFYDVVTERLARYRREETERLQATVQPPNPEDRFTELVGQYVDPGDTVLDIGCGNGGWLLATVAPRCDRAIGLDYGHRRLAQAVEKATRLRAANAAFFFADARYIPLPDGAVSAVVSRRGPLTENQAFLREGCRVLRPGGLALEIGIGERNRSEIYAVFGRGQMYGEPERGPRLDRLVAMCRARGLTPIVAESLLTHEYLPGREGLVFQLETTPTVDDFDPVADAGLVDQVVARNLTDRGIRLTMHRLVLVARKETA